MAELLRHSAYKKKNIKLKQRLQRRLILHHPSPADLLVDHVTHGHPDLHARPLDVVKVEVVEYRQADGAEGHPGCVAQRLVKRRLVVRVIIFEEADDLTQDDRLHYFNGLLISKEEQRVSR